MRLFDVLKGLKGIGIRKHDAMSIEQFVNYLEEITKQRDVELMDTKGLVQFDNYIREIILPVPYDWIYDVFTYSDTIRVIVRTIRDELFKNGLVIEPKFAVRCRVCGTEYDVEVEECEECGSKDFERPSKDERKRLEEFIQDVNLNDQSLLDVLKEVEIDLLLVDNAYIFVRKKYSFNEQGELIGSEFKELVRIDPKKVKLVLNKKGEPAKDNKGNRINFCLEHRDKIFNEDRCPICGKKGFPAYYVLMSEGKKLHYTKGEIIHLKKFSSGIGYGIPPLLCVWRKVMTLFLIERYILLRYRLQRSPQAILLIRSQNPEAVQRYWNLMISKAKDNPHLLYPAVIPDSGEKGNVVEYIPLSTTEDTEALEVARQLQLSIGAVYGVSPLYMGETGKGLTNEGLQVTITNRVIKMGQEVYNTKLLPKITKLLGIEGWRLKLGPAEERDETARLERIARKIEIVEKLREMGYEVELVKSGVDGIDFIFKGRKKKKEEEGKSQTEGETPKSESLRQRFQGVPEEYGLVSSVEQRLQGQPEIPRRR